MSSKEELWTLVMFIGMPPSKITIVKNINLWMCQTVLWRSWCSYCTLRGRVTPSSVQRALKVAQQFDLWMLPPALCNFQQNLNKILGREEEREKRRSIVVKFKKSPYLNCFSCDSNWLCTKMFSECLQ